MPRLPRLLWRQDQFLGCREVGTGGDSLRLTTFLLPYDHHLVPVPTTSVLFFDIWIRLVFCLQHILQLFCFLFSCFHTRCWPLATPWFLLGYSLQISEDAVLVRQAGSRPIDAAVESESHGDSFSMQCRPMVVPKHLPVICVGQ